VANETKAFVKMRLTSITPCWDRPERTLRCAESIANQNFKGFESIFIGDGCPKFQSLLDEGKFKPFEEQAAKNGNVMIFKNLDVHSGGYGYIARKEAINMAKGKYIMFVDNDDVILPNHFKNNCEYMEKHPLLDFGYSNTYLEPTDNVRNAKLAPDCIGNAEIIVNTKFLKKTYVSNPNYGHDWLLVKNMMKRSSKYAKILNEPTYIVKSYGMHREKGID
jgi:glycosyltransferase involved in cell wall biosynthesis